MNDGPPPARDRPDAAGGRDGTVIRVLKICNQKVLHARAAAKFVQTAEKFDAEVRVTGGTCGNPATGPRSWIS
jgi:hypothetical protein